MLRFLAEARDLNTNQNVQNGYGTYPVPYSASFRVLFLQVKRVESETDQSPLS
jgi:hypothetical protein